MVNKRFDIVFLHGAKGVGFVSIGEPDYIKEPVTKTFQGIAYTYLCTDKGVYSTNNLQLFDKKEGDWYVLDRNNP